MSSCSSSRPLILLTFLNFRINNFSVWVIPTPTPRTKIFIDILVDGADSRLLEGIFRGRSVATQPNVRPFPDCVLLQINRLVVWFVTLTHKPVGCASSSSYVPSFLSRIAQIHLQLRHNVILLSEQFIVLDDLPLLVWY